MFIPITLNEETQKLYDNLRENGYDLFNENDSFYTDICTSYKSENGTDVLLSDRKNDFYNTNETTCQANCKYSAYSSESKYLKCECSVTSDEIDTVEPQKLRGETAYKIFYEVLKYSNFGVLKCYKLVFNFDYFKKNYGSIIAFIYFLIYIIFVIIYIIRGLSPLKIDISNLISKLSEDNKYVDGKPKIKNNKTIKTKIKALNKKNSSKSAKILDSLNKNKNDLPKLNNKNKKLTNKKLSFPVKRKTKQAKSLKVGSTRKSGIRKISKKSYDKLDSKSMININNQSSNLKKKLNRVETKRDTKKSNRKNNPKNKKEKIIPNENNKHIKKLSNFELNELEYFEAIQLDKRKFHEIYWSILRREHIILFTFFSWNDFNLLYVKLAKFVFLICQDFAMNVVFFSDESMHKIYVTYGKYNFIQQIPQIIYSTTISQLIEVFLCYLSLTDKHYYQIKALKNQEMNNKIVYKILRCVKLKLLGFFTFTLILFTFYWYFISAFCAVYLNTQIIFIKDSTMSFLTGLLYPFVLYLFPAILRIISLADSIKKRFKCIYKISDIIPIF